MKTLRINVANKIATYHRRDGLIVCGNSDYQIKFTFDGEWDEYQTKIARFIWNGKHTDVEINADNTCPVPMLLNTTELAIGVYAEGIATTTPARIDCVRSVLCGDEPLTEADENYTSEAKAAAAEAKVSETSAAASATSAKADAEIARQFAGNTESIEARISRNDKRITNLEHGISQDDFVTDSSVAYQKDVPANALPYAEVEHVGGMTYRDTTTNTLKDSRVTDVKSIGANLFDPSGIDKTQTGIKFDTRGAYVRLNGTKTAGQNMVSVTAPNILLPKGTYTVSIQIIEGGIDSSNSTNYGGIMFSINKNDYSRRTTAALKVGDIGTRTFTLAEDTLVTSFDVTPSFGGEGTVYTNVLIACQLERNNTRSDFVPYKENSLPIPDAVQALDGYGEGMNESVYNYIDWEQKQFVKRVGKLTLNGSGTTWTSTGSAGLYNASLMNNAKKHNNSAVYALCNAIPYTTNAGYLSSYYIARVNNDRGLQFNNVLELYGLSGNSSAAFNAYLAEHPITFVYELETPVVTDISDLITDDNFIEVEGGGAVTFENEHRQAVPSIINYQVEGSV